VVYMSIWKKLRDKVVGQTDKSEQQIKAEQQAKAKQRKAKHQALAERHGKVKALNESEPKSKDKQPAKSEQQDKEKKPLNAEQRAEAKHQIQSERQGEIKQPSETKQKDKGIQPSITEKQDKETQQTKDENSTNSAPDKMTLSQKAIEEPSSSKQKALMEPVNIQAPETINAIKQQLVNIDDAIFKEFQTAEGPVTIMYFSTLVNSKKLLETVVLPITNEIEYVLSTFEEADTNNVDSIVMSIVEGETILYFHQLNRVLKVKTYSPPERAIIPTDTETTVIGPQDSFTESLQTNLSLIKRRIRQPGLKTVERIIGTETKTKISIIYLENLVNEENLKRVEDRIAKIDYPGFTDITMLKQQIEDDPYSPFPQFYLTVRPDSTVIWLLDGRIVVAMDNSPSVMVCPTSFLEMFFTPEDFYNRWTTASLLRILRFFGFFITIMLTPMYISALTYHPGILPYELLIMLQESRSRVPFPPVIEVLFIELVIEVLRESGSRMPSKIGQTIGIVGGIVIGTAAVEAGLVSNTLIVLVAISALLSFLMPSFLMSNASRFIRYIFILSAGLFGLFGQMLALAWLFNHLLNLTSLGAPYMTPVIPRKMTDFTDSLIRFPLKFIRKTRGISRAKK